MAGAKKPDSRLITTFVSRLARKLVSDNDSGFSRAVNPQVLTEVLRKSINSLPSGTLRSALQLVLEQERQHELLISALQIELGVLSVKLELHGDVLLTSSVSEHLFQTLLNCLNVKRESSFTDALEKHFLTHDETNLLLARDPAIYILWALAAMELRLADRASGDLASAVFRYLKPWLVDRNTPVAIATIAPLVPLIFTSLQTTSKDVGMLKSLRALVKEVLSFIVAVNYKERFLKRFNKSCSKETLSFQSLLDGCFTFLKAFEVQGTSLTETPSVEEKLNSMFPLASELTRIILKPTDIQIGLLADIVKAEFLLLYVTVEVLYCREKSKGGEMMVNGDIGFLRELVGRIDVYNRTAGQQDLILDNLLSDLSALNTLLDDEEKSLVCSSIFKALLLYKHGSLEKHNSGILSKSKRSVEGFVKRIAVARKFSTERRKSNDILEALACHTTVPPSVVRFLKSGKMHKTSQIKDFKNDGALIDWLIQASDTQFQLFVKGIMNPDLQADESVSSGKVDVDNTKDSALTQIVHDQDETEDLFFLDTAGEKKVQDSAAAIRQGKNSKKRKAKQVIFHREGRVMSVTQNLSLSDISSPSDSENSQNDVKTLSLEDID